MTKDVEFLGTIPVETLDHPSIPKKKVLVTVEDTSWMIPILSYIKEGKAPDDNIESRRML